MRKESKDWLISNAPKYVLEDIIELKLKYVKSIIEQMENETVKDDIFVENVELTKEEFDKIRELFRK